MPILSTEQSRGPVRWVLKPQEDGSVEVYQGRKRVAQQDDMTQASAYVRERLVAGDRVLTEDPDGYLSKTRLKRRRWRQSLLA